MTDQALLIVTDDTIEIYSPYNARFVADLKECIPSEDRVWHPDDRMWEVSGDMYQEALEICERHFLNVKVEIKP